MSEQTVGEIKALVDWVEVMDRREKEREERGGEGEGVDGGQGQEEGVPAFTFKPRCEAWSTGAEEEHCVDGGQGKLMKCTRVSPFSLLSFLLLSPRLKGAEPEPDI